VTGGQWKASVDWSGLPCEAHFWDRKLGPAKAPTTCRGRSDGSIVTLVWIAIEAPQALAPSARDGRGQPGGDRHFLSRKNWGLPVAGA